MATIGVKLKLGRREVDIMTCDSEIHWADRVHCQIHQERQDCYLDISEVRELLQAMEQLKARG